MFLYWVISLLLVGVLSLATLALSSEMSELQNKSASFECGFIPLSKSSSSISMQFLGVLLIFLIFDLEILFLVSVVFSSFFLILLFLLFLVGSLLVESFFFGILWKV